MDKKGQLNKILYSVGFALIVLGGACLAIWNLKLLGYILAVAGVICAGIGKIVEK